MIKKIDHINITVTDLSASKKFFIELLDFQLAAEGKLEGKWIDQVVGLTGVQAEYAQLIIPGSETKLELICYYQPIDHKHHHPTESHQIGLRHFALAVQQIEAVYQKLKAAGIRFYSEIQVYNQCKKLCYFQGPDNVIIELSEYGTYT